MASPTDDGNSVEQYSWAVWITDTTTAARSSSKECVSVLASDRDTAIDFALEETGRTEDDVADINVDGPFQDCEPGYYEFTYYTENRERVMVEAPSEDYAEEMAEARRDHRGEYVQTVRTEKHHQEKDLERYHEEPERQNRASTDDDATAPSAREREVDFEVEKERCHSLYEFER